ncbi:MAG: MFS transporter [Ktedonobacteraceae bacterium]
MDSIASPHRLTVREQLVLSVLWFSLNAQSAALLPIVIPTQILLFVAPGQIGNAQQAAFLGWLSTLGAVVSLFVPPLIGMWSDHTINAFGRRRPFIVLGTLCVLLSVPMLIEARDIVIFVFGLAILQVGMNVITAAYQSLTPDRVPKEQRGAASGYMGLMTILGNVSSLALAAWLFGQVGLNAAEGDTIHHGTYLFYILTSVILIAGVFVTVVGIHETPYKVSLAVSTQNEEQLPQRLQHWIHRNWLEPWHDYNFTVVFLTRFSVMMGLALFMTFIEYYFADVTHSSNFVQTTAAVAILALLGAVFSAFLLGVFSDRVKRAPLVSIATVFMALASLAFVVFNGNFPLWPLGVVFGLGYGAYTSVDWALSVDALPSMNSVGKDLGLWNASATLPTIIAPLLGSIIISQVHEYGSTALGYRLIFAVATLFLLLAAVFVLFVRERREIHSEITPRRSRPSVNIGWKLAFQTRGGNARGFLRFWPFWEWLTRSIEHIQPIPNAPHHLLEVRFTRYSGRPIDLRDGTHVQKGDSVIEFHFRNRAFLEMAEQAETDAWVYMRTLAQNLQALAQWMQQADFPSDVHALYGITLLSRGAPRLGFTLRPRPKTFHTWLDRFFMTGLLVLYNPKGGARLLQGTTYGTYPQEAWMSRKELLQRYGGMNQSQEG